MARAPAKSSPQDRPGRPVRASDDERRAALDELTARFDANLASLKDPQTANKARRVFAAKGKFRNPPKAGQAF
jgi:hypothetical protein